MPLWTKHGQLRSNEEATTSNRLAMRATSNPRWSLPAGQARVICVSWQRSGVWEERGEMLVHKYWELDDSTEQP